MLRKLTLLFTSDEHGFVAAQAKLQNQVRKARQENPQGTLLVSSGDVFEGSAENSVLGLDSSREMMKAAGYDVMTLGNHDFDRGPEVAREWVKKAPAKMLVSNVVDSRTGKLLENASPSQIFELNGVKLGLVGATTPDTPTFLPADKLKGIAFQDPKIAVKAEVEKLKSQGVELIGLVSHLGLEADHDMAKAVPELDFILGGHTHAALEKPDTEGHTLIMHPGCFRKSMGRLDLNVDTESSQVHDFEYHLLKGTGEDEGEVGHLAEGFSAKVDEAMGEVVGDLPKSLAYNPSELGEAMETLMDSSVRDRAQADMVMVNQKVIRTGLKAGNVTRRDIFNAFPFDNRFVKVKMAPDQVAKVLAESFRRLDQTSLTVAAPVTVAGDIATHQLRVLREVPTSELGDREPLLQTGYEDKTVPIWQPANDDLSVVTTDYLVQGGLNYLQPGTVVEEDLGLIRDNVLDYVKHQYPAK